jgi:threonine dehydratase
MAKMAASLRSGVPEAQDPSLATLLDGIAGPRAGQRTLTVLRRHKVHACSVTDDQAARAVRAAFTTLKLVVEPGGAAALAAVRTGRDRRRSQGRRCHDPLTTAESINDPRRPHLSTRPELGQRSPTGANRPRNLE